MKKIFLSLIAVALMTTAMAQDNKSADKANKRIDPKEMVEKRTQEMTEKYCLSNEQIAQVKALNEKYMGQMGSRGGNRGPRPDFGGQNGGPRHKPDMNGGKRPERPQGGKPGFGGPDMSKYNEELKTILNEAQYKAYEADLEKMKQQMQERMQQMQNNK